MADAHSIYLARTYAYVAAGAHGLVILDIEKPGRAQDRSGLQRRRLHQRPARREARHHLCQRVCLPGRRQERLARGAAHVARDAGQPRLQPAADAAADRHLQAARSAGQRGPSQRGLDRDRAVDESGNQIGVFGRVGARPLNAEEQRKMYLRNGRLWTVSDDPNDPCYRRMSMHSE